MRKKIIAGNWKMNKTFAEGIDLIADLKIKGKDSEADLILVIPPFIHLKEFADFKCDKLKIGAQNCHHKESGAYTGEVSVDMLKSVGVEYSLVGHSERRQYFKETDDELFAKVKLLIDNNISPIFCCGEQLEERKSGNHFATVGKQLEILWKLKKSEFRELIIAYEPVWAIGTGETATAEQAQEMHQFIRLEIAKKLDVGVAEEVSILYGGSCKPANADEIFSMPDVDGGLIGGASLNADDFIAISNSF